MGGLQTGTSASWSLRYEGGCLSSPFYRDWSGKPQVKNPSQHAVGLTEPAELSPEIRSLMKIRLYKHWC